MMIRFFVIGGVCLNMCCVLVLKNISGQIYYKIPK
jgi:hypothetical protein